MDEDNLKKIIGELTNKLEQLESQLKDLQSQQLETGNNIVTLIQHAETMNNVTDASGCLLYTSPSPRDLSTSRMPSSA